MRRIAILAAAALATPAGAQTKPAATPLAPSGKWSIEYHEAMCVLSRDFGVGEDKVTLAFRPWTLAQQVELVVVDGELVGGGQDTGKAAVAVGPAGKAETVDFFMVREPKTKRRFTTLTINRDPLKALGAAGTMAVAIRGKPMASFALTGMVAAMAAVETCETDLAKSWGVDPTLRDRVAVGARSIGQPGDWITVADYPTSAIAASQQGTTTLLFTINEVGRISACRVIRSAGYATLDEAACNAITRRARYTPALGKDGKPIATSQSRRVAWRLP